MNAIDTNNVMKFIRGIYVIVILSMLSLSVLSDESNKVSLTLNNIEISEAMEMLSIKERVNIVLSKEVKGDVSINLFNVSLHEAIMAIAGAAGFAVEFRNNSYFVLSREESGKYANSGLTELRTYKVEYSDVNDVEQILEAHLSEYGTITSLAQRKLLVIEDLPSFLTRIEKLLAAIDSEPQQIFIEAKILEISLRDSESYGLNWSKLFSSDDGNGSFGTRGLSNPFSPGLFFDLLTPNIEVALDYLFERGRLRTLSTPKLLALEDKEAEVIVGDRLGFRVTTTINQITSESIEFLESGVIMRVTPGVDRQGRIMLDIHPEVSTGRVEDGIPNQVTTEVSTQMLVNDGQTVFIGGLIRRSLDQSRAGVPVLGNVPIIGKVFSNSSVSSINTETVVMITPHIVKNHNNAVNNAEKARAENIQQEFINESTDIDKLFYRNESDQSSVNTQGIKPGDFVDESKSVEDSSTVAKSNTRLGCSDYNPANLSKHNCQTLLSKGDQ